MKLTQGLPLRAGMAVSVVGGGGKTSTIFTAANELCATHGAILVTTTTAFFHPDRDGYAYHRLVVGDVSNEQWRRYAVSGQVVVAARAPMAVPAKLKGYSPESIDAIQSAGFFEFIFVEADGSKGRPVKAPAAHEPVVPGCTAMTIGVIGLDCLGKPLTVDFVHRPECMSKVTGLEAGGLISDETLVSLVDSPQGLFCKVSDQSLKIVLLNKADGHQLMDQGTVLAEKIARRCTHVDRVLVASLRDQDPVKVVI